MATSTEDGGVMIAPIQADPPTAEGLATTENEVLTVEEAASLLRIDRKTLYEAIARGEVQGVRRIGSRVFRLRRTTLLEWLAQGQGRVPRSRGSR